MDEIFLGFAALAAVLFILFGPWIFAIRTNNRRKREREEDQRRWAELTSRLHTAEQELKKLRDPAPPPAYRATPATEAPAAPVVTPQPAATPPQMRTEAQVTQKRLETPLAEEVAQMRVAP